MSNNMIGIFMVAGIIIPTMLLVVYFLYNQRKQQKEKKS